MPADAVAMDLRDALDALGEITGEVTSADILNTMFANFCVGK
jgi:tRNA modification GTPase